MKSLNALLIPFICSFGWLAFAPVSTASAMQNARINARRVQPIGLIPRPRIPRPGISGTDGKEIVGGGNLFQPDLKKARALETAITLLKGGDYTNGYKVIRKLLEMKEDSLFYQDIEKRSRFLSLKTEALRTIAAQSKVGRDAYELRYGISAGKRLTTAIAAGDFSEIKDIARSEFHTKAGYQATYLSGCYEMDRGNWLNAAIEFTRLRKLSSSGIIDLTPFEPMLSLRTAVCWGRAGLPKLSVETLVALKKATRGRPITIRGRQVAMFKESKTALSWLVTSLKSTQNFAMLGEEQWTMFRGNSTRTGSSGESSPIADTKWTALTILDAARGGESPDQFKILQEQFNTLKKTRAAASDQYLSIPTTHPLLVGNFVLVRAVRGIGAFYLDTGKHEWFSTLKGNQFSKMLDQPKGARQTSFLEQRAWRDMTSGTLSSDGQLVFCVEELGYLVSSSNKQPQRGWNPRGQISLNGVAGENLLSAYDIKSGLLQWQLGGDDHGKAALLLADACFLGAPLPIGGLLFCLIELDGEIQLAVLDPNTGDSKEPVRLIWKNRLLIPERKIKVHPLRHMAGLTPSSDGGVLVCPTCAGAVVAMDPARRTFLWGYRYQSKLSQANARVPHSQLQRDIKNDDKGRWVDSTPTISVANDAVLLTPRDSNELHCLDSREGKLRWKQPRGQGLYIATVYNDNAVIVGKTSVKAVRLKDGKPGWKQAIPIPAPSGRGFQIGKYYHIPLSTAEIVTINLENGRLIARSKTRSGEVRGNLVSANGMIVSQSGDRIVGFKTLTELEKEIEEALKETSGQEISIQGTGDQGTGDQGTGDQGTKDQGKPGQLQSRRAAALLMRGQMRLHAGNEQGGLTDLRASIKIESSERACRLIVNCLMEGLRLDFAKYRQHLAEVEKLLSDPEQRYLYLRLCAHGLDTIGENFAAFQKYLAFSKLKIEKQKTFEFDGSLTIRGDFWVRSRIGHVYRTANKTDRAKMDRELDAQLAVASKGGWTDLLESFLTYCGELPQAEKARHQLILRMELPRDRRQMFQHLAILQRSSNSKMAGFATARLAQMMLASQKYHFAATCVDQLLTKYANVVCLDKKTGKEIAAAMKSEKFTPFLRTGKKSLWPQKRLVISSKLKVKNQQISRSRGYTPLRIRFSGLRGSYYQGWSCQLNYTSSPYRFELLDRLGHLRFYVNDQSLNVALRKMSRSNMITNFSKLCSIQASGRLLILSVGTDFAVISPPQSEHSTRGITLWENPLLSESQDEIFNHPYSRAGTIELKSVIVGGQEITRAEVGRQWCGMVAAASDELLVYQTGSKLYAVKLLTGKKDEDDKDDIIWTCSLPSDCCYVFGDTEHLFVVPTQTSTGAIIVRFRDGKILDRRAPVGLATQIHYQNQHVLNFVQQQKTAVLQRTNLLTGKLQWKKTFSAGSLFQLVGDNEVAIAERNTGRFVVLDIVTGKIRVDQKVTFKGQVGGILVHRTATRYVLLSSPENTLNDFATISTLVTGNVYGFDRQSGQLAWTTDIGSHYFSHSQSVDSPVLLFNSYILRSPIMVIAVPQPLGKQASRKLDLIDIRNGRNFHSQFSKPKQLLKRPQLGRFPRPRPATNTADSLSSLIVDPVKKTVNLIFTNPQLNKEFHFSKTDLK